MEMKQTGLTNYKFYVDIALEASSIPLLIKRNKYGIDSASEAYHHSVRYILLKDLLISRFFDA